MSAATDTPTRALRRGMLAGALGTAAMTAAQSAYYAPDLGFHLLYGLTVARMHEL